MTQSRAYQHQSRIAIRKSAYYARPAPDLAIQTLNDVVGTDFLSVLGRKIHICQRFFYTVADLFRSFLQFHVSEFFCNRFCFLNRTPSRGQRKNIKFSRPAAIRCWPLFMRRGKACAFPSASGRPDCAGHVSCCNSEYTAGSSEQARAC